MILFKPSLNNLGICALEKTARAEKDMRILAGVFRYPAPVDEKRFGA
jgi:hypothetical protein